MNKIDELEKRIEALENPHIVSDGVMPEHMHKMKDLSPEMHEAINEHFDELIDEPKQQEPKNLHIPRCEICEYYAADTNKCWAVKGDAIYGISGCEFVNKYGRENQAEEPKAQEVKDLSHTFLHNQVAKLREENADLRKQQESWDTEHAELVALNKKRLLEIAELEHVFETQRQADKRAIQMWHDAGGDALTWPDSADLCVWLMGQVDELKQRIEKIREAGDTCGLRMSHDWTCPASRLAPLAPKAGTEEAGKWQLDTV